MTQQQACFAKGRCACGNFQFQLAAPPLIVQCCHCKICQRDSGSAFLVHALIETSNIVMNKGRPQPVAFPSGYGKGHKVCRCPICKTALWNQYPEFGDTISYIRTGTLEEADQLTPQVHLHTAEKQSWVILPPDIPAASEHYNREEVWSKESLARLEDSGFAFPQKWLQKILTSGPFGKGPED